MLTLQPSAVLLLRALSCPAELSDLQDLEGAAQTTVGLLSQNAPERNLLSCCKFPALQS